MPALTSDSHRGPKNCSASHHVFDFMLLQLLVAAVPCLARNGENDPLHLLLEKRWQTMGSHNGRLLPWQLENAGMLRNSDIHSAAIYCNEMRRDNREVSFGTRLI